MGVVRGDDQQRAGPDFGLLIADLGPQPALLHQHDLLGLVEVLRDHDPALVDDAGHHRLLARHRLAEDAGNVLHRRELVPGRDLAHLATPCSDAEDFLGA